MGNLIEKLSLLGDGRWRVVCPVCGGGEKQEKTFVVSVEGKNVAYLCFRASCSAKGGRGDISSIPSSSPTSTGRRARDVFISGYDREPVYDNEGGAQGWVHRSRKEGGKYIRTPKSLLHTNENWCNLHFPKHYYNTPVLLVEDRASAERMAPLYPTVALLGTHLNEEKISYMIGCGIKYGIVALDEDATAKAISILHTHSFVKDIIALQRDLKDEGAVRLLSLAVKLEEREGK